MTLIVQPNPPPPIRNRYRVRFTKTGLLRWIGHRDLQRLWERMLRRRDLRLSMSEGFHPKPRISFPSALALGFEGHDEVVEIELAQALEAHELHRRLGEDQQPGLEIVSVRLISTGGGNGLSATYAPGLGKAKLCRSDYEVELPFAFDVDRIDAAIAAVKRLKTLSIQRRDKTVTAELETALPLFERRGNRILISQIETGAASLKPTDVLTAAGLNDLIDNGAIIRRIRVHLSDESQRRPETTPPPLIPTLTEKVERNHLQTHPNQTDSVNSL